MKHSVKNLLSANKALLVLFILIVQVKLSPAQFFLNKAYDRELYEFFGGGVAKINDSIICVNGLEGNDAVKWNFRITCININSGDTLWNNVLKHPTDSYIYGIGNTMTIFNNHIYATCFKQDLSGNAQPLIIKYNLSGDTLWTKLITTGATYARFDAMQITRDSNFVFAGLKRLGASNDNFYLVKTDTNGVIIWQNTFGGANDELAYSVDTTADNGFIMAGYTNSYGAGSYDAYVVKTDSVGNFIWHKWYGGIKSDYGFVKSQKDTTYLLHGGIKNSAGTLQTAYIYKLDENGDPIWQTTPNFPADNTAILNEMNAVCVDLYNNIVLSGNYSSTILAGRPVGFIYKLNQNGDSLLFENYYNRIEDNYFSTIIPLNDGGFVMSGYVFPDTTAGSTEDGWLVRIDSMGCENMSCVLSVPENNQPHSTGELILYPNPANTHFTAEINGMEAQGNVALYDIYGRSILSLSLSNNQAIINVSDLANGIYQVVYIDKNEKLSQKLVVSK